MRTNLSVAVTLMIQAAKTILVVVSALFSHRGSNRRKSILSGAHGRLHGADAKVAGSWHCPEQVHTADRVLRRRIARALIFGDFVSCGARGWRADRDCDGLGNAKAKRGE